MKPSASLYTAANDALGFEQQCLEWLRGIGDGDETALESFYTRTVASVYGLAMRITRDHAMAEDTVTEVYHQVWTKARSYDPSRGRPIVWLLAIGRSRALDQLRRESRARRIQDSLDPTDSAYLEVESLESIDARSRVSQVLSGLSDMQRHVLLLSFYRDFSHQQIADHLDLPLGTVKSHARRGLDAMREGLARDVA